MADKPLLHYFDNRGLAEIIRITLCLGGVEFDQKYLQTREEFVEKGNDGTFLFRCVPYLKWGGVELCQSNAIVRYVARKTGLVGSNEEETARIDMIYEASRDFQRPYEWMVFMDVDTIIKQLKEDVLPKFLPLFEKILQDNGTGYLVGEKPTIADAGLLQCLLATVDFIGAEAFVDHQHIEKFLHTMNSLPNIENYLANIRKPPNTKERVSHVRKILNWSEDNNPIK